MSHKDLSKDRRLLIGFIMTVLVGCTTMTPAGLSVKTNASLSDTPSPVATIISPGSIIQPTETTLPRLILSLGAATITPTIRPTTASMPIPTLTDKTAAEFVADLVRTNGNCELPCWWGGKIIPGYTNIEDAYNFFASQGIPLLLPDGILGIDIPSTDVPFDYAVQVKVEDNDARVQSIILSGEVYGGMSDQAKPSRHFTLDWSRYAWSQVLQSFGKPSQIKVAMYPSDYAEPAGYWLILFYEHLGMAIRYGGPH